MSLTTINPLPRYAMYTLSGVRKVRVRVLHYEGAGRMRILMPDDTARTVARATLTFVKG